MEKLYFKRKNEKENNDYVVFDKEDGYYIFADRHTGKLDRMKIGGFLNKFEFVGN